jgi:uncharacterized protein
LPSDAVPVKHGGLDLLESLPAGHRPGDPLVVLAHGAGTNMRHRFLESFAAGLASEGLGVVRFDFAYTEAGRRRPDPTAALETRWREVLATVRADPRLAPRVVFGAGKSMGGRIATHVAAADPDAFAALALLGYPLHPPGRPEKMRDAHLAQAARNAPLLFVSGTRDDLCRMDLLRPVLATLGPGARLHEIPEGDHSLRVPKRTGKSEADVLGEVVSVAAAFFRDAA